MAKVSAKGAVITLNSQDLSKYISSYEIEWAQQVDEVTGFTDGWKNYLAGVPMAGLTLDFFWQTTADANNVYITLKTLMGTPATCSIVPEAGGPSFSGTFFCDGIKPAGQASSGAITMTGVHLSASGTTIATFAS